MKLGVCLPLNSEKLDDVKTTIANSGAQFIEGNHFALSSIDKTDFDKIINFTRAINLPITHTNCFLGSMNIFDSKALLKEGEEYVKRSCERCSGSDLKHVTGGSGGSRKSNENRSVGKNCVFTGIYCKSYQRKARARWRRVDRNHQG